MKSAAEQRLMRRALVLARRGSGFVSPNPPVGAVAARSGRILAEGWHRRLGGPHAEAEAIAAAAALGRDLRGGDLFVTLEPCAHHGKTPPCSSAIVAAGFRRVRYAAPDPNPLTQGKGPEELRQAGIDVEAGLCEEAARWLLAPYYRWMTARVPLVTAKWAMTADGSVATTAGDSRWISSPSTLRRTRRERSVYDAILVGRGTLERDDPRLLSAPGAKPNPLRVVLDSELSIGVDSALVRSVSEAPLLLVGVEQTPASVEREARRARLADSGVDVLLLPRGDAGGVALAPLLERLGERGITHLLVEGGPAVLGSWFRERRVDRVQVIVAPKLLAGSGRQPISAAGCEEMARALELRGLSWRRSGRDRLLAGALTPAGLGRFGERMLDF